VAYRIAQTPGRKARRGILNAAECIVRSEATYWHFVQGERKNDISFREVKNRWRRFSSVSIFIFLLLHHNKAFDLLPGRITASSFSKILLRQANNIQGIKLLFATYRELCEKIWLRTQFEQLDLDLSVNASSLSFKPISAEVITDGFKMAEWERKRAKPKKRHSSVDPLLRRLEGGSR
jgi:hypothetical protein